MYEDVSIGLAFNSPEKYGVKLSTVLTSLLGNLISRVGAPVSSDGTFRALGMEFF